MEELGNSLPLSESMVDAENSSHKSELSKTCLNCGAALNGEYCSQCGQKNIPRRQTLGELFENFLGSFFSYESKFFRTIKFLMSKPGYLALEYNSGRRERYYHPARMYVFISFIYFLLFFSLPDNGERNDAIQTNDVTDSTSSIKKYNFNFTPVEYETQEAYDSVQAALPATERDGWIMRQIQYRNLELKKAYEEDEEQFDKEFGDSFVSNVPKVLFFLLPIFALLLKLLYVRRDFYYSEHLVQSIYLYNFSFAVGIVTLLLELIPALDWLSSVTVFGIALYLLLAMKTVYKQRWGKTIGKFLILSFAFLILVAFGLFANLVITLLMF